MKYLAALLILFSTIQAFGQDIVFEDMDLPQLVAIEEAYADSVLGNPNAIQVYTKHKAYKFLGTITGKWREFPEGKRVFSKNAFEDSADIFDDLAKEFEVQQGEITRWMTLPKDMLKTFKKDMKGSKEVYIYAEYFIHRAYTGSMTDIFVVRKYVPL